MGVIILFLFNRHIVVYDLRLFLVAKMIVLMLTNDKLFYQEVI